MTKARDIAGSSLESPNRNLLYNGAMQVHQRGTSATGVVSGGEVRVADRWRSGPVSAGTWTETIENDAPTGSGFSKSLKLLCTTANNSLSANSVMTINQRLEGQDLQRIAKGTSAAKELTLSFWVKSNVTGTYVAELYDSDNTRQSSNTYTINSSATWEYKSITFPADINGTFDNDNNLSMQVFFFLVVGTDFSSGTLNTAWNSVVSANRAPGQVNVAAATNNYWQITGVQLEVGDTATEFEYLPYGVELARCQRYYYAHAEGAAEVVGTGVSYANNQVYVSVHFPTTMRIWNPTAISANGTDYFRYYVNATTDQFNSLATQTTSANSAMLYQSSGVSTTVNHCGWVTTHNANSYIHFDAEL